MSDRTPAETIREAAKLMRERAEAVDAEMASNPYWASDPEQSPAPARSERYRLGVTGGLGGASGEMASAWDIDANLAVGDWLDSEAGRADGMDGYEDSDAYPLMLEGFRHPLAVARLYLGEVA